MRVKTLRIDRHGPLGEFSRSDFGDFTVIHAPNEYGKTLIIDALVKLLLRREFGRVARHLGNIQRVDEPPEGFLVLESEGRQIRIEAHESITDYLPIDAAGFRNIFIVRDSDLGMVEQAKFYAQLSERLAGLRTSEIDRIKRILQQKGRLTNPSANSDLSKAASVDHAGRRVEAARRMIREIENKMTVFTNSDFDRLERRLVDGRDRIARIESEIELLEYAGRREQHENAGRQLDELRQTTAELERLSSRRQ